MAKESKRSSRRNGKRKYMIVTAIAAGVITMMTLSPAIAAPEAENLKKMSEAGLTEAQMNKLAPEMDAGIVTELNEELGGKVLSPEQYLILYCEKDEGFDEVIREKIGMLAE